MKEDSVLLSSLLSSSSRITPTSISVNTMQEDDTATPITPTSTTGTPTTPTTTTGTGTGTGTTRMIHLQIDGMMCQRNCGSTVTAALEGVPGVHAAAAIFAEQRAWVELNTNHEDNNNNNNNNNTIVNNHHATTAALIEAVEDVGFDAVVIDNLDDYLQQVVREKENQQRKIQQQQQEALESS
eukprot:scaffold9754_cov145-Amphora_coffeaeformis.AAC.1